MEATGEMVMAKLYFHLEKPEINYEDLDYLKLVMQLLEYRGISSSIVQGCEHG